MIDARSRSGGSTCSTERGSASAAGPQALHLVAAVGAGLHVELERRPAPRRRERRAGRRRRRREASWLGAGHASSPGVKPSASCVAHLLEAEPHAALDGPDRHAEHLGDLAVAEAAEVGELDRSPLLVRQLLERARARRAPPRGAPPPRRCARGPRSAPRSLERLAPALVDGAPAQRVDRPVVDDAEHPGADAAARLVVAQAAAPDGQERLLRDVLSRHSVPHHSIGE